jgi:hypothetical protein
MLRKNNLYKVVLMSENFRTKKIRIYVDSGHRTILFVNVIWTLSSVRIKQRFRGHLTLSPCPIEMKGELKQLDHWKIYRS